MCGICGIWLSPASERSVDAGSIRRMSQAIAHRGPDAQGEHVAAKLGLGHRRLSIIDVANGAQPMASADGRCRVVYNGEIYNFAPLRRELEAAGRRFRTRCDTEVIVEGYAHWGAGVFERLSGMYAFALEDCHTGALYLVRDRLGIKPLYYAVVDDGVVFGSEIRAILASGLVPSSVEPALIDAYMSLGYVPGRRTLFRGISKVLPAHYLEVSAAGHAEHRYWDLSAVAPLAIGFEDACRAFDERFKEVVEQHLMSDVPLGVFLSGGVDSSAVTAFVSRELGRPVATFSVGYADDPLSSELEHAAAVARLLGTDHHEFVLTHSDFFDGIDTLLEHAEEPVVESAAVALLGLSRYAAEHATVFLSGEGADEVFAGYDLYRRSLGIEKLRRALSPAGARLASALMRRFSPSERVTKHLDWLSDSLRLRYRGISADVTASIRREMYPASDEDTMAPHFAGLFDEVAGWDALAQMQYVDIKTWLVDDLLLKADKMTMAASVELRVPFLDHRLVEFGVALPAGVKVRDGVGKAIVKASLRRHLPGRIVDRPKQGFPVPVSKWLREDLYERAAEILLDGGARIRDYVDGAYISKCVAQHRSGRQDFGRRLFSLLVLELWHRKYAGAATLATS